MNTPVQTNRADPNVVLPKAVLASAARANELSERLRAASAPPGNSQSNPAPAPAVNTGFRGMAVTDFDPRNPRPPGTDDALNSPPAVAQPRTMTPAPDNVTPISNATGYSEQQFKSMQGRFERSQQENKALVDRLGEMQRLVAFMNGPPQPPAPSNVGRGDVQFNVPITPAVQRLITEKERNEYGEDLLDVVGRRAREAVEPEFAALRAENDQLKRALGGIHNNVALDARSRLYTELNKEVPDWETVNNDEGFKHWANQVDPLSGSQRLALIHNAFNTGQASRVIHAFKSYKAEQAALSPAQDGGQQPGNGVPRSRGNNASYSPSNETTTPAVDLTSLAAPGRAGSGQVPTSPDKPIVLGSEITQFYKDVTLGRYKGREQEYGAIERQIQEALREGRVRKDQ
jgi:hypothetical protein